MANALTDFKETIILPLLLDSGYITTAFQSYDFKPKGDKWVTPRHTDGTTSHDRDQSYIYKNGDTLCDQNGGRIGLIDLYMRENGQDYTTALRSLAKLCGVEDKFPTYDSKNESESRRIQENRQNALDRFIKNLWSGRDEARKVLDFLHARQWTDEDIKRAELGLITPDLRSDLPDAQYYYLNPKGDGVVIGETHLLTIPYRTGSRITGFKFRNLLSKEETVSTFGSDSRYRNSIGLAKNEGLFGMGIGVKEAIIVEGELDALHAKVKGARGVVATTGGTITEAQAQDAIRRGVRRFTLLFDMDERGQGFISSALDTLDAMGAEVYVSSISESKDTDEYLRDHTIEEWESEVSRNSIASYVYRYEQIERKYIDLCQSQGGELLDKQSIDFFSEVEKIFYTPYLLSYPHLRERVFARVEAQAPDLQIDPTEFRKWINNSAERQAQAQREREIKESLSRQAQLLKDGKTEEALALMKETAEAQEDKVASRTLAPLLHDDIDETLSSMRNKPKGIYTNFVLGKDKYNLDYRLYLPSGGITTIAALTGHGKSKMLMSLALDALSEEADGTILYITFEENKQSVIRQMINAYADLDLTDNRGKHGNLQTIGEYFSTGSTQYMRVATIEPFKQKVEEFKSMYRQGRIKVIRPTDNYSTTLLSLLRYALSELGKIRGIFIDYAQELYLPDAKAKIRTDELKQIMVSLDQFAQETDLPVVMGAQLRAQTKSPSSFTNQDIADSAWIGNKSSEVVLLWSNKEKAKGENGDKETEKINKDYPDLRLGEGGRILAVLTKSRQTQTGIYAVLDINGNTGRIKGNRQEETSSTDSPLYAPPKREPLPF